jgi:hypothetical protein
MGGIAGKIGSAIGTVMGAGIWGGGGGRGDTPRLRRAREAAGFLNRNRDTD